MRAIDVECGTAQKSGTGFDYGECVDVFADLCITAGEQGTVMGEAMEKLVDGACVLQLCFACSHERLG